MVKEPQVSVCIANFNGMDMIDACIDSVRNQRCGAIVEIIVHDDASTDGSAAYIRTKHKDVRLIESAVNVGFCIANNRMAREARGKYFLLLNNDAILFSDALDTFLEEATRLYCPAILTLPQYRAEDSELIDVGSFLDPFLNPRPNQNMAVASVSAVAGACLWIDKMLWQELGGFPEWFSSIGEDLYLCCRARLAGYPVRALGKSGYRHRCGASFGGGRVTDGRLRSTFRRRALSERNKTFVMAICYPAPWMQIVLPVHLLLLLVEGILLSLLRLDTAYLRVIYLPVFGGLWRRRKELRTVRAETQKSRRLASADFFAAFNWVPYKLRMLMRHGLPRVR